MTDLASRSTTIVGTCHHDCPDSCGWVVTVDGDGTAVKLRGDKTHPFSRGELCPKVNHFLDRVYHPDRILTPLRRVGAKGEGRFEPVSWDDALAAYAAHITGSIERHGGETLVGYQSAGNQSTLALGFPQRLWHALGATRITGALCGAVAGAGSAVTLGSGRSLDPMELVHARLIILWGTNTRLTNRHLWPFITRARDAGARVVVIDPVRTLTAESADWFIQPRPGTDVALMLAMMHVLIRDDLVDHDWLAAHADGFDDLAVAVADWTPARAAEATGVAAAEIEELARRYGTIRPAAIRTLIGAEHGEHGAMFFRTLTCLPALVGAWRDRGGGFSRSVGVWAEEVSDRAALTRPDLLAGRSTRSFPMPHLGRVLVDPDYDPPVTVLSISGGNPLVASPNSELLRRGLLRDDLFTVVHEQFLTDTARYADLVLPATTQIESVDMTESWGHLYLGWNGAAIEPVGESVSNSELARRLAGALGLTEPALFDDDLTVLAATYPDVDLDVLRTEGRIRVPYPADGRPYGDGRFATATGRVQLRVDGLDSLGVPALPTYVPPPAPDGDGWFTLLTPKTHTRFLNTSYSHLPKHGGQETGPYVELTEDDAASVGLGPDDLAVVANNRAELVLPVRISDRVTTGTAAVVWGWWGEHHGGPDGAVANSLTSDTLTDWGAGVAYNDTLVRISRTDQG
ncbi:MAG: molybdopterin-dependent oxidoreductase [Acidimicrobiales bacterium]